MAEVVRRVVETMCSSPSGPQGRWVICRKRPGDGCVYADKMVASCRVKCVAEREMVMCKD